MLRLWIVVRRSSEGTTACPDEKDVYKPYLYRIWCPLFIAEALLATGVREVGKMDV